MFSFILILLSGVFGYFIWQAIAQAIWAARYNRHQPGRESAPVRLSNETVRACIRNGAGLVMVMVFALIIAGALIL